MVGLVMVKLWICFLVVILFLCMSILIGAACVGFIVKFGLIIGIGFGLVFFSVVVSPIIFHWHDIKKWWKSNIYRDKIKEGEIYRICQNSNNEFKIERLETFSIFGKVLHKYYEDADKKIKKLILETLENIQWGKKIWKPIRKEKSKMNTNYENAMSIKKEYEDLKKQLEEIKAKMLSVKHKAKEELNWIMNDKIEE